MLSSQKLNNIILIMICNEKPIRLIRGGGGKLNRYRCARSVQCVPDENEKGIFLSYNLCYGLTNSCCYNMVMRVTKNILIVTVK